MARGRGRGRSSGRSNPAIRVSMPTIPMSNIVSPHQGSTPTCETSAQSVTPTISETPPVTPNQTHPIGQGLSSKSNPTNQGLSSQSNPTGQGLSTQSNPTDQGLSTQSNPIGHSNTIAEGYSSCSHTRTLIFLTSAGLVHSFAFYSFSFFSTYVSLLAFRF